MVCIVCRFLCVFLCFFADCLSFVFSQCSFIAAFSMYRDRCVFFFYTFTDRLALSSARIAVPTAFPRNVSHHASPPASQDPFGRHFGEFSRALWVFFLYFDLNSFLFSSLRFCPPVRGALTLAHLSISSPSPSPLPSACLGLKSAHFPPPPLALLYFPSPLRPALSGIFFSPFLSYASRAVSPATRQATLV